MNQQQINASDYRTFMQAAARSYLERRKGQYLAGDDHLFNACVNHLVTSLEVPVFLAQSLAQRAWDELCPERKPELVLAGVEPATGEACGAITDRLLIVSLIDKHPKHP